MYSAYWMIHWLGLKVVLGKIGVLRVLRGIWVESQA